MRRALLVPLALLLALPAAGLRADPPRIEGYGRIRELRDRLLTRLTKLREEEEFQRKPYPEKLLIWFERGEEKAPDGKLLRGQYVVRELFRWDAMRDHNAPQEVLDVLDRLPGAMRTRFRDAIPIPKSERMRASLELADYLNDDYFHIRKAAINAIAAIYNETKQYQPDMSPRERRSKEKEIKDMIRKLAR